MKKLFSKEIIFITPLILILSFFLFTSNVKADTYTGTISSNFFDYNSDNSYTDLKVYMDNYMQQNNLSYYIIIYITDNYGTPNFNRLQAYLYSTLPTYSIRSYSNRLNLYSGINSSVILKKDKNNPNVIVSPAAAFYNVNNYVGDPDYGTSYMIIDTNIDFIYNGPNSYIFNSPYDTYTISSGVKLKGLVELANSTPPDNTPILTDFFTLTIDKLGVISNYFSDNVYLYFIPLIPILILCIYLIKRSLIK